MARIRMSERELDLMQTMWSFGKPVSVSEIHQEVVRGGADLAYTTVQTMLNRLTAKGHVKRRLEGRAYLYSPAVKEPAAAQSAVRTLLDRFFSGSAADLAAHLVEGEMTDEELRRVERLLEARRRGKS